MIFLFKGGFLKDLLYNEYRKLFSAKKYFAKYDV